MNLLTPLKSVLVGGAGLRIAMAITVSSAVTTVVAAPMAKQAYDARAEQRALEAQEPGPDDPGEPGEPGGPGGPGGPGPDDTVAGDSTSTSTTLVVTTTMVDGSTTTTIVPVESTTTITLPFESTTVPPTVVETTTPVTEPPTTTEPEPPTTTEPVTTTTEPEVTTTTEPVTTTTEAPTTTTEPTTTTTEPTPAAEIRVALDPSRQPSQLLDGARLGTFGNLFIYVFLDTDPNAQQVHYVLERPGPDYSHSEFFFPFDMAGTFGSGDPAPFLILPGDHHLDVTVTNEDGSTTHLTADFRVEVQAGDSSRPATDSFF